MPDLTLEQWIALGVSLGYCSEQICNTHDGMPLSETEDILFSNGNDPCVHVVRLGTEAEWEETAKDLLGDESCDL